MGGYGSTRWGGYRAKTLVEDCRVLDLKSLIQEKVVRPGSSFNGRWSWMRDGAPVASIRIQTVVGLEDGRIGLSYEVTRNGVPQDMKAGIDLETTKLVSGGRRWWFCCPASRDGEPCRRRCSKLYLTPRSPVFACRTCWDLRYESNRTSRKWDSLLGRLTKELNLPPGYVKQMDREFRRS